jgi:hypothetical protein
MKRSDSIKGFSGYKLGTKSCLGTIWVFRRRITQGLMMPHGSFWLTHVTGSMPRGRLALVHITRVGPIAEKIWWKVGPQLTRGTNRMMTHQQWRYIHTSENQVTHGSFWLTHVIRPMPHNRLALVHATKVGPTIVKTWWKVGPLLTHGTYRVMPHQ